MRQALPLEMKIQFTQKSIREWVKKFGRDGVYVSFSGGKDSTVLLDICRKMYPEMEAVFADTGLEFPEIREFVKTKENVTWVKPAKRGRNYSFKQVIEDYGYPIVSKEQSCYIDQYRNTGNEKLRDARWNGKTGYSNSGVGKISEKWKYLVDAPFKISDRCCYFLKKQPIKRYEKKSSKKPIIGTMAGESSLRRINYERYGCNAFDLKRPISTPMSFWNEEDVWDYIKKYDLEYSKIYDMGYHRTGCVFCMFGYHLEKRKGYDRLKMLEKTHPKLYDYVINKLGFDKVLEWYPERKENGIL